MNMAKKTDRMKKYIFLNNVVIVIQIVLIILSVAFDFLIGDDAVFITVFVHVAVFVLYNVIAENIIEYGYLRKKFAEVCDETHPLRYFILRRRMYKTAVNKNDRVSSKLIIQSAVKSLLAASSIISLMFMVSFE